ncbi:MAG: hypothetical protein WAR24_17735, partial [Candidatus Acidiferrales bacterium]
KRRARNRIAWKICGLREAHLKCRDVVLATFLAMVGAVTPLHSPAPQVMAIRAGRLFDSKSGQALADQIVLIEGDKITAAGPTSSVQIPSGAQVIDLGKATVLPGLIDGHTHVFGYGNAGIKSGGAPFANLINDTREYRTLLALANAQIRTSEPVSRRCVT